LEKKKKKKMLRGRLVSFRTCGGNSEKKARGGKLMGSKDAQAAKPKVGGPEILRGGGHAKGEFKVKKRGCTASRPWKSRGGKGRRNGRPGAVVDYITWRSFVERDYGS